MESQSLRQCLFLLCHGARLATALLKFHRESFLHSIPGNLKEITHLFYLFVDFFLCSLTTTEKY